MLPKKVYDALKWVAMVGLPSAGTLYFAVAQIWHLPLAEEVVGTITAVDTFLGVLLGISTKVYNTNTVSGGDLVVSQRDDKKLFSLQLEGDPNDLQVGQTVTFKVVQSQ